jgi:4-amino-4-deoxy-L-arabinose transferase-like glycosyltransferase
VEKIKIIFKKIFTRPEPIILFIILLLGVILRLYKIEGFMTFLGDEGRDMIIVRRLLVNGDFFLIGPGTSVGNMYLGPLYYYLIAPALFLANYSPVGPSIFVALIGVATIYLVWYVSRKWFGEIPAVIAALLYAVSPVVIVNSRSSWNPNVMPFFALLTIFSLWSIWQEKKYYWLYVLGIALAFCLQSHYLAVLLLPVIIIIWLVSYRNIRNSKLEIRKFIKHSAIGLGIFLLFMSPLLVFDIRHDWMNVRALTALLGGSGGSAFFGPAQALTKLPSIAFLIFSGLTGAGNRLLSAILVILLTLVGLAAFSRRAKTPIRKGTTILLLWLATGIIGVAFFNHEIYAHYFGFLFPAPVILLAAVFDYLLRELGLAGKLLVAVVTLAILIASVVNSPVRVVPGNQMQRAITVAEEIKTEAREERFNLAVIAENNYEDGYKYFLEAWGEKVIHLDPQRFTDSITAQLFVVCEMPEDKCDPTHSPKAEVANFGWSKIENQWQIEDVVLYKLVHSK